LSCSKPPKGGDRLRLGAKSAAPYRGLSQIQGATSPPVDTGGKQTSAPFVGAEKLQSVQMRSLVRPNRGFARIPQPRRAASIVVMSLFLIWIIASKGIKEGSTVAQVARCFPLVNPVSRIRRWKQFSNRRLRHAKCNPDLEKGGRRGECACCACSRLEASSAIVTWRQSVWFRACVPSRGLFAECDGFELRKHDRTASKPLCHRISHLGSSQLRGN
jgi:hypothetical protein